MKLIQFTNQAKDDLEEWIKSNPKVLSKIMNLIIDIDKNHPNGKGKPEKLIGYENKYSRRITEKDRLVYSINGNVIMINQCKGHYDDK